MKDLKRSGSYLRSVTLLCAITCWCATLPASGQEAPPPTPTQELNVAHQEVTVLDFASGQPLSIAGDVTNSGTIYLVSSNPAVTSGILSALNITNTSTGTITSMLPSGGIAGYDFLVPNFSFSLAAVQNITNSGVISSAGSLTMTAGNAISNITAVGSSQALIQALGSITMMSAMGTIANQGTIASAAGNINMTAPILQNLVVNNQNGILSALQGSINLRDSMIDNKINTAILGGDILSRELNIYSGCGNAVINANEISGIVNINAGEAHVTAASPNLHLGQMNLIDDPTFFNIAGDVVIDTALNFSGFPLAIVAKGDVLTAPGVGIISTSSSTGNAGDITIVAGAEFTSSQPNFTSPFADVTLTITGASSSGGKIALAGANPITGLEAKATGATGSGGNVVLVAYQGVNPNSGTITLPSNVTVQTGGATRNGDVSVLAGSAGGNAITIGSVDTGSAGTGGNINIIEGPIYTNNVTLTNAKLTSPTAALPLLIMNDPNRPLPAEAMYNVSGFTILTPATNANLLNITPNPYNSTAYAPGKITTGALTARGHDVQVMSRSGVLTGSIDVGGTGTRDGGSVTIRSTVAGGTFGVAAGVTNGVNGSINANSGNLGGSGGSIRILVQNNISVSAASNITAKSVAGNGGTIELSAGVFGFAPLGTVTLAGGSYSVSAEAGNYNGGKFTVKATDINITGTGKLNLAANASGNGNGGTIDLQASDLRTNAGSLTLSATGGSLGSNSGNGGTIKLTGNVYFDQNFANAQPLGLNGDGGHYILASTFSSPDISLSYLNASAAGSGKGGSIEIQSSSAAPFYLGPSGAYLIAQGGEGGGSITLNAQSIVVEDFAAIDVQQQSGDGGTISLGPVTGEENIRYDGVVSLPFGTISVDGIGDGASGGYVRIQGLQIPPDLGRGPLTITANGAEKGNGGTIQVVITPGETVTLGQGDRELHLSAAGGIAGSDGGNGGSILVATDTGLTLNELPEYHPQGDNGDGGSLHLVAPEIFWDGPISADAAGHGNGGKIILESTSNINPFTIGSSSPDPNTITGFLSAQGEAGGTISLASSGILIVADSSAINVTAFSGKGGSIDLLGNLQLAAGTYAANSGGDGEGGHVGLSFSTLSVFGAGTLFLQANGAGNYNGGTVTVNGFNDAPFSIGQNNGDIQISATGGSRGSDSGNGGSVTLFSLWTGSMSIDPSGIDQRPLGTNGDGGTLYLGGGFQVAGSVNLDGVGTGSGGIFRTFIPGDISIGKGFTTNGVFGDISARGGSDDGAGGSILLNYLAGLALGSGDSLNVSGRDGTGEIYIDGNNYGAAKATLPGGTYGSAATGKLTIRIDQLIATGASPVKFLAHNLNINSGYNTLTLGHNAGQVEVAGDAVRIYANNIVADPSAISAPNSLILHGATTTKVNGNLQGINNLQVAYGTWFPSTFVIGGPIVNSGITGTVNVGSFNLVPQNAVNGMNVVIQGAVTTTNGFTLTEFRDFQPTNISGGGKINGPLNVIGGQTTINLPGMTSSPLLIGSIISTGSGAVSITVPSLSLPTTASKITSAGTITLNTANILNNGVISTPLALTVQNPSGVKITGNGVMAGNPVHFTSTAGSVDVTQGLIIGTVTGSGLTGFKVTFGSRLTTSQLLNPTINQSLLQAANRVATTININQTNNSSVVLNTDTVMRKVSLLKEDAVNYQRANQVFTLACSDGESDLYCEEDTEVESDQYNATILSSGKMLVDTGKNERVVKAGSATFIVPPQSSALVEKKNGRVRVVSIGGKGAVVANVSGQSHAIKPGQDLLIGDNLADEEEFISVDQAESAVSASIEKLSHTVRRRTTTVVSAIRREIMIGGVMVSIGGRASDRQKRVLAHVDEAVGTESPSARVYDNIYWSQSIALNNGSTIRVLHSLGTDISIAGEAPMLKVGKLIVSAGKSGLRVGTPQGELALDPDSVATVQVSDRGTMTTQMLSGNAHYTDSSGHTESASRGQEMLAQANGLTEQELAPVDGIERGNMIESGGGKVQHTTVKRSISLQQLVQKDIMINGSLVHVRGVGTSAHKKYVENLKAGLSQDSIEPSPSNNAIRPIAFSMPVPARHNVARGVPLLRHVNKSIDFIDGDKSILVFDNASTVKSEFGTCSFSKGAIVYANYNRRTGNLHIMNIHGVVEARLLNSQRAVKTGIPGEELILSRDSKIAFEDSVARRNVHLLGSTPGKKLSAHVAEFSILSLLMKEEPVRNAINAEQNLRHKALKNCAAVQMAFNRGAYKQMDRE